MFTRGSFLGLARPPRLVSRTCRNSKNGQTFQRLAALRGWFWRIPEVQSASLLYLLLGLLWKLRWDRRTSNLTAVFFRGWIYMDFSLFIPGWKLQNADFGMGESPKTWAKVGSSSGQWEAPAWKIYPDIFCVRRSFRDWNWQGIKQQKLERNNCLMLERQIRLFLDYDIFIPFLCIQVLTLFSRNVHICWTWPVAALANAMLFGHVEGTQLEEFSGWVPH